MPKESRAELMPAIVQLARERFKGDDAAVTEYLLAYFTTIDLVHILAELKK
jgi:hypothetical protein